MSVKQHKRHWPFPVRKTKRTFKACRLTCWAHVFQAEDLQPPASALGGPTREFRRLQDALAQEVPRWDRRVLQSQEQPQLDGRECELAALNSTRNED